MYWHFYWNSNLISRSTLDLTSPTCSCPLQMGIRLTRGRRWLSVFRWPNIFAFYRWNPKFTLIFPAMLSRPPRLPALATRKGRRARNVWSLSFGKRWKDIPDLSSQKLIGHLRPIFGQYMKARWQHLKIQKQGKKVTKWMWYFWFWQVRTILASNPVARNGILWKCRTNVL